MAEKALSDFDRLSSDKAINDERLFQWRVRKRPVGNVTPDDFEWFEGEIPEPNSITPLSSIAVSPSTIVP